MKRQVRRGMFETNSSSTHAICIAKDRQYVTNDYILFGHGEYGWENGEEYDTASYLHEMIHEIYYDNKEKQDEIKNKISETLKSYGITSEWEEDKFYQWSDGSDQTYDSGYIDHGSGCVDLLNDLLNDDCLLLSFLFGDSFIITGNDNGDAFQARMHDFEKHIDSKWGGWNEYKDEYKEEFNDYDIYFKGN